MLYAMRLIPGNDPDALADRLAEDLAAVGPLLGDPLAPVPVLIPNAGLRDWLRQALAERLGVCAGIDLLTPAAFTDCWLPDRLGVPRIPDEDQTWRLMALLAGDERDPLRRFRLAGIHADCLRRYRLHRPEWLRAWRDSDDDGVQARLWHGLVAAGADPLAAWDRLLEAAETGENAPTFLAGFATADLAPEVLRLLALLGGHGRVHLYTLQPVAGDWTDQRTRRRRLQDDDPDDHPLLGDWGVAGRGFLRRADDAGAVWSDRGAFAEPAGDRLLDRIRRGMAEARVPDPAPVADEDDSLTFHATHGPRRTLEAAKHQLVRWFAADPGLAPHEVALLCPDPALFAPLARAVFADAGDGPAIPLDAPDRRGDEGLAGVLLRLLELVPGRWEATAVLDLLGCAPVAEAWDLDGEALARIRAWCDGAVLRWGVDAAHRADLGLPGTRHGTWRHGLARIQAALWAGDDGAAAAAAGEPGWEAAWPAAGISDGDRDLADRVTTVLLPLLDAAAPWRAGMPAEDWAAALPRILAGLCPDHPDLPDLGYAIEDWRRAVAAAGIADALPAAVVAAALESRFADLPGAFVRGAVVLAGLRPLRALPFRVVMLLGMDDGAFPRQGRPSADDRLRREPRPGDPDPRHEDRQALLDTLITTRDRLWIAWTGMDPRTGEELPPAPVVGDLLAHAAQVTGLDDDQAATRLVRRHRLLAAQDDPGPAWPAADLPAVAAALVRRPRTVDRCGPCADAPRPLRLDLDTIVRGWLRPDRVWLRRLGVRQVWLDAPPADDEGAPADRDDRRDLAALLVEGSATEADRAIAFGLLPPGPPGALALAALEADLGPLPVRARALREAATRTVLRLEHAGITVAVPVELLPDGPWTWAEDADTPARLRAAVLAILAQAAGHGPGRLITPKPKAAVIRVPAAADPAAALALLLRPWTDPGPVPWHPGAALAIAAGKDPEPVWPADAAARLVWPDPDRPWQHDGFGGLSDAWLPLLAAPADGWVGP